MKRRVTSSPQSPQQPTKAVKQAFLLECVRVAIGNLVPLKVIKPAVKASKDYRRLVGSIRAVGPVEPPAIAEIEDRPGYYYIVDGHLKIEALQELGVKEVDCIIATEEDTYTYNKRVNRVSPIQEHKMIARAIARGVSEEQIAEALGLSMQVVRQRSRLLTGVCDEAAEILQKHPRCPAKVFALFRKMKPMRQIEAAGIMKKQNDFSTPMAKFLILSTDPEQLVPDDKKPPKAVSAQSIAAIEKELQTLRMRYKEDEEQVSKEAVDLDVIIDYLAALLSRKPIVRWLLKHQRQSAESLAQIAEVRLSAPKLRPRSPSEERERPQP